MVAIIAPKSRHPGARNPTERSGNRSPKSTIAKITIATTHSKTKRTVSCRASVMLWCSWPGKSGRTNGEPSAMVNPIALAIRERDRRITA